MHRKCIGRKDSDLDIDVRYFKSQEEEKIGTELLFLQEPLGVLGHVLTVLSHPNALSEHRELYIWV